MKKMSDALIEFNIGFVGGHYHSKINSSIQGFHLLNQSPFIQTFDISSGLMLNLNGKAANKEIANGYK